MMGEGTPAKLAGYRENFLASVEAATGAGGIWPGTSLCRLFGFQSDPSAWRVAWQPMLTETGRPAM